LGLEVQKAAVKGADATSKVISDQMNFILGMLVDRSLDVPRYCVFGRPE
jgi:hypothetical protein